MGSVNLSTISISNGGTQDQEIYYIILYKIAFILPTIEVRCELTTAFPNTQSYNLTISTNSNQQKILNISGSSNHINYDIPMSSLTADELNMKDILNDIIDNKTQFRINIEVSN